VGVVDDVLDVKVSFFLGGEMSWHTLMNIAKVLTDEVKSYNILVNI